jgi:uncharacterized protein (DUF2062 family)
MLRSSFRRLLALDDPPERTALAFSVGVLIAFSPLLGLHTILATLLAFIFRFNKVAIYAGTFVNNPVLTLVPIIFLSYAVGAALTGRPLALPAEGVELLRHPHILTAPYWRELWARFWDLLLPFALGGMALSVVCSLAAYPVTLKLLRANQRRRNRL